MMEPHMIDFVEIASSVENYILIVFVIVVNHVGFIGSGLLELADKSNSIVAIE